MFVEKYSDWEMITEIYPKKETYRSWRQILRDWDIWIIVKWIIWGESEKWTQERRLTFSSSEVRNFVLKKLRKEWKEISYAILDGIEEKALTEFDQLQWVSVEKSVEQ